MFSGECVLIIDGQRFEHCTCAMEKDGGSSRSFGFLSAPSDLLDRALTAQRVEIGLGNHPPFGIKTLAINSGIALFTFLQARPIRVTLSSGHWMAVVEGGEVRDVCIRAERELREKGSVEGPIKCQVLGADRDAAAAITDYVAGVQLSMIDPGHMRASPSVIHVLELVKLEDSIRRAERLVSRQRRCVETLTQMGWQADFSARLLDNLTVSLALLHKHRDLVRRELVQPE